MRQIPLLEKLNDYDIAKISHIADEERFNKGDYIVRQYSTGYTFYIILQGACQVKNHENFWIFIYFVSGTNRGCKQTEKTSWNAQKGRFLWRVGLDQSRNSFKKSFLARSVKRKIKKIF